MGRGNEKILIAKEPYPEGLSEIYRLVGESNVELVDGLDGQGVELPLRTISDCTVMFADFLPRNVTDASSLRWLQLGSAGYEQVLDLPLVEMDVRVTTGSGVNDVPIAEWCVVMMLMFERDIPGLLENQRQAVWDRSPRFQAQVRGRRVGIVGYGNIGREVARLSGCLGLEVWAINRSPIGPRPDRYRVPGTGDPQGVLPQRTFRLAQMGQFLPDLDYVVLTLPLTPSTRKIIGEEELRLMKPSAVLLNPARGSLVEEMALLQALKRGWIAGAALDAHFHYPLPADDPLWGMPNVVLTPHISGSGGSRHYLSRVWQLFTINLSRYVNEEPLLNELARRDLSSESDAGDRPQEDVNI